MWKNGSISQIAAGQNWESLHHSALNIGSMKAIDFFIAWGYIDFSLWLCFPQTQEEEKQLQTDAQIAQTFPQRKDPKTDTWQDRAAKDTRWKAAELESSDTKPVERLFLPPARLLGGGHLFLAQRGFDLFASASASSIYKGHEREWVIHLSVFTSVCVYVFDLTYFCCTDMRLAFQPHKYNCRHSCMRRFFPRVEKARENVCENTKYVHNSTFCKSTFTYSLNVLWVCMSLLDRPASLAITRPVTHKHEMFDCKYCLFVLSL